MNDPTLELTRQLVSAASITPSDAGCQEILQQRLQPLGFSIEQLDFADDRGAVKNFWARRGEQSPLLVFAGHTDVVPPGELSAWDSDPFTPTEKEGYLYGRGTADMKCSLAAFITAIEAFLAKQPEHKGSLALLITSDEEGPATCGTRKVMQVLQQREEKIDYCLVGEPSSSEILGDVIKIGRRGSISGHLKIIGVQGHVAYPEKADNPIHHCARVLQALTSIEWDAGNSHFPPTSFQVSNINGGTGASNVIPESVSIEFNLRFSTETSADEIQQRVAQTLQSLGIRHELQWTVYGHPFLTEGGELISACSAAILEETDVETTLSTSGGTSDGRFIAPSGAQVVELGPVNASIHKINERVSLDTPAKLSALYTAIMQRLLVT